MASAAIVSRSEESSPVPVPKSEDCGTVRAGAGCTFHPPDEVTMH